MLPTASAVPTAAATGHPKTAIPGANPLAAAAGVITPSPPTATVITISEATKNPGGRNVCCRNVCNGHQSRSDCAAGSRPFLAKKPARPGRRCECPSSNWRGGIRSSGRRKWFLFEAMWTYAGSRRWGKRRSRRPHPAAVAAAAGRRWADFAVANRGRRALERMYRRSPDAELYRSDRLNVCGSVLPADRHAVRKGSEVNLNEGCIRFCGGS